MLYRSRPQSAVQRFCRDTQTTQQRHERQQTAHETSTQMTQIGTYISTQHDRLVQPQPYTSADQRYRTINDKVRQSFCLYVIVCQFLADHTNGRAYGTVVVSLSVRLSVTDVFWLNCKSYRGSAMVPLDRALETFYRLSIVTMSPSAAVWQQFLMESFKL